MLASRTERDSRRARGLKSACRTGAFSANQRKHAPAGALAPAPATRPRDRHRGRRASGHVGAPPPGCSLELAFLRVPTDAPGVGPPGIWLDLPFVPRYCQMPDEQPLRAKAREAVERGKVPSRRPDRTLGRPGVGAVCAVCDEPVVSNQLECRDPVHPRRRQPGAGQVPRPHQVLRVVGVRAASRPRRPSLLIAPRLGDRHQNDPARAGVSPEERADRLWQ